jgi:spore coat protein JB
LENNRQKALRKLMAARFALHDAELYLDSHPDCQEGLRYFRAKREQMEKLRNEYEAEFGSLTAACAKADERWEWVCGAFPWERGES